MSLEFKTASRSGVKPLIGIFAESGCGKTLSALYLARGIAGPTGKVGMIDTESGRGSLYADVIPGGYTVLELQPPFTPRRHVECIEAAEKAGLDVLVWDSASHEWEGLGGVLDMATENETKSGKPGLHNWRAPKMEHGILLQKLLQTRLIIIVCIRAKFKTRQVKEGGRTQIVKDDVVSPIQAEDFIFEMTAHMEIIPNHNIRLTKCSHPALRACFPKDDTEPLAIKHGELIAKWSTSPGPIGSAQTSAPATSTPGATATAPPKQTPAMLDLKKRLAAKAKGPFGLPDDPRSEDYRKKWGSFTDWLMQNEIITRELKTLSEDELRAVVETVEAKTDEELSERF